jgi:predicted RNase H-like nuclease
MPDTHELVHDLAALRASFMLWTMSDHEFIKADAALLVALERALDWDRAAISTAEDEIDGLVCAALTAYGLRRVPGGLWFRGAGYVAEVAR